MKKKFAAAADIQSDQQKNRSLITIKIAQNKRRWQREEKTVVNNQQNDHRIKIKRNAEMKKEKKTKQNTNRIVSTANRTNVSVLSLCSWSQNPAKIESKQTAQQ